MDDVPAGFLDEDNIKLYCAEFDLAVVRHIFKDNRPLDTVEGEGFIELMQTVQPCYTLPSRRTITRRIIPEVYQAAIEELKNVCSTSIITNFIRYSRKWTEYRFLWTVGSV